MRLASGDYFMANKWVGKDGKSRIEITVVERDPRRTAIAVVTEEDLPKIIERLKDFTGGSNV